MTDIELVNNIGQRAKRFQQVKSFLTENHNKWLDNNEPEELYAHVIHSSRVERILDFTRDIRGKILDIGCFDGYVTEKIQRQGGKEVIGMDRLKKALKIAEGRGIQTRLADIDNEFIDFPDNYFDCVVAADVLPTVFDPDAVIEDIYRVLKPGGKLIVTVPNLASISNRLLMMLGFGPFKWEVRPHQGNYWRYFTFGTMRELLSDYHFDVQSIASNIFVCPLVRIWFNRWPLVRVLYRWRWVQKVLGPKPEYKRHRIFFSKSLARIFPRMGENIIVLAEKSTVITRQVGN